MNKTGEIAKTAINKLTSAPPYVQSRSFSPVKVRDEAESEHYPSTPAPELSHHQQALPVIQYLMKLMIESTLVQYRQINSLKSKLAQANHMDLNPQDHQWHYQWYKRVTRNYHKLNHMEEQSQRYNEDNPELLSEFVCYFAPLFEPMLQQFENEQNTKLPAGHNKLPDLDYRHISKDIEGSPAQAKVKNEDKGNPAYIYNAQSNEQVNYLTGVVDRLSQIVVLMSFKLADLVNIALDEKTYFKSKEWCEKNKHSMMVEHDQQAWTHQFFQRYQQLRDHEKSHAQAKKGYLCSEYLHPIVQFFKTLKHYTPTLRTRSNSITRGVQTEREIGEPYDIIPDQSKDLKIEYLVQTIKYLDKMNASLKDVKSAKRSSPQRFGPTQNDKAYKGTDNERGTSSNLDSIRQKPKENNPYSKPPYRQKEVIIRRSIPRNRKHSHAIHEASPPKEITQSSERIDYSKLKSQAFDLTVSQSSSRHHQSYNSINSGFMSKTRPYNDRNVSPYLKRNKTTEKLRPKNNYQSKISPYRENFDRSDYIAKDQAHTNIRELYESIDRRLKSKSLTYVQGSVKIYQYGHKTKFQIIKDHVRPVKLPSTKMTNQDSNKSFMSTGSYYKNLSKINYRITDKLMGTRYQYFGNSRDNSVAQDDNYDSRGYNGVDQRGSQSAQDMKTMAYKVLNGTKMVQSSAVLQNRLLEVLAKDQQNQT